MQIPHIVPANFPRTAIVTGSDSGIGITWHTTRRCPLYSTGGERQGSLGRGPRLDLTAPACTCTSRESARPHTARQRGGSAC
jgi:hypothetical protein